MTDIDSAMNRIDYIEKSIDHHKNSIESLKQEKARLVEKVNNALPDGYEIVSTRNPSVSYGFKFDFFVDKLLTQYPIDKTDPENWKPGDIIEAVYNEFDFSKGRYYEYTGKSSWGSCRVKADDKGAPNGWSFKCFKFVCSKDEEIKCES